MKGFGSWGYKRRGPRKGLLLSRVRLQCTFTFPEGGFLQKASYQKSPVSQRSQNSHGEWMHHVLYPRFVAFEAFLFPLVKDRLRYVVDVTYTIQTIVRKINSVFIIPLYPSASLYSLMNFNSSPYMYVCMTQTSPWRDVAKPEWLIALWQRKERRLLASPTPKKREVSESRSSVTANMTYDLRASAGE